VSQRRFGISKLEGTQPKHERKIIMTKNKNYYFPSPWLHADDLPAEGKDYTCTGIEDYTDRDQVVKPVLTFLETDKKLILNATQFGDMMRLTGEEDADQWAGTRVKLVPVIITITDKKAGTTKDVPTIKIQPTSPLVATDKPLVEEPIFQSGESKNEDDEEGIPF